MRWQYRSSGEGAKQLKLWGSPACRRCKVGNANDMYGLLQVLDPRLRDADSMPSDGRDGSK